MYISILNNVMTYEDNLCFVYDLNFHCVRSRRGLSGVKSAPFRHWYGNLGELRSLLEGVSFVVCTTTATSTTKRNIFDVLCLNNDTFVVEMSPERGNLKYCIQYVDNSLDLSVVFSQIINEVKSKKESTCRTIIYCQTRKQCAILWHIFKLQLGVHFYAYGKEKPINYLVQMFHAGTPDSTKSLILENILQLDGHIRILICTVAFGMGVNCKGVYRVIHFGPSLNIESYVQECGRAGRDSICILLHNGLLSSHCSADMREYIVGDKCRRQQLLKQFPSPSELNVSGCKCCDICASKCDCSGIVGDCGVKFPLTFDEEERSQHTFTKSRVVTEQQKEILKSKLLEYMNKIRHNCKNPVLFPNVHFEFSMFHVSQVLENCARLFLICDVCNCVEIWRSEYAQHILTVLSDVFNDIDTVDLNFDHMDDMNDLDSTIGSDWADVRDDSIDVNLSLNDTANLSDIGMAMHVIDQSDDEHANVSGILSEFAIEASCNINIEAMDTSK